MKYIMVLNDGETWTDLNNCAIVQVPEDAEIDEIEKQLGEDDGTDFVAVFSEAADGEIWMIHNPTNTPPIRHRASENKQCKFCHAPLHRDGHNVWVDRTNGDGCSGDDNGVNENESHVPDG